MQTLDRKTYLDELNTYGYQFKSINDVVYINSNDKVLIPVLLRYLKEVEDIDNKEYLVRCLTCKGYYEATRTLLDEYYDAADSNYKWTIGNALEIIRDSRYLDEYISIMHDSKNGNSRKMIALLLGTFRNEKTKQVLLEVLHQKFISPHVIHALGRYKDRNLIVHLEYFTDDENRLKWIQEVEQLKHSNPEYDCVDAKGAWKLMRKNAEKAISKLSKY